MTSSIPKFSDLPLDKNGPHHNAWGLYGPDDQLGTLNRLTNPIIAQTASTEILTGVRINLDWPLDAQRSTPFFARQPFTQNLYQKPPRIVNDDVWTFNTQSSSQWDGFRHFGYQQEKVFYNGVTLDEIHGREGKEKTDNLGIGAWKDFGGIIGRGILLDFHAWRTKRGMDWDAFATRGISAATLQTIAHEQGTAIKFGDVLIVRTGWTQAFYALREEEKEALRARQPLTFAGVEQSEEMMAFLWEHFAACAGDHPSWEAWPTQREYALHEVMLAGWGMPIGELWDLERLAEECERQKRWSFFLCSQPVNVPGGVASPPNVVAIF